MIKPIHSCILLGGTRKKQTNRQKKDEYIYIIFPHVSGDTNLLFTPRVVPLSKLTANKPFYCFTDKKDNNEEQNNECAGGDIQIIRKQQTAHATDKSDGNASINNLAEIGGKEIDSDLRQSQQTHQQHNPDQTDT